MQRESGTFEGVRPASLYLMIFSLITGVIGTFFTVAGIYLLALGGSCYYLISGPMLIASAVAVWRGLAIGRWLYAAFLTLTLAWSIWETGLGIWELVARLCAPAIWSVYLLLPWAGRGLSKRSASVAVSHSLRAQAVASGLSALSLVSAAFLPAHPYVEGHSAPPLALVRADRSATTGSAAEWRYYGGTQAATRYSPLSSINLGNVGQLKPLWVAHTGMKGMNPGYMSATPLMVGDRLFTCTPANVVIAMDPATGREIWRYDPNDDQRGFTNVATCRGLAYFEAPSATECRSRILTATLDARLLAIDAQSGRPCHSFGQNGVVDLKEGIGLIRPGFYSVASPPVIVHGKVVVNSHVLDNAEVDEPSGVIRAFDAVTGRFAWAWDMGHPERATPAPPGQTYTRGTPNSWAPMSGDERLGMVYLPTGATTPDYWGGSRPKVADRFSSSIIALDADTGRLRWSFQAVHHDVWDRDVASQPTLIDLQRNGQLVPALIQPTKRGQVFVLDRRTGKPIFPIVERAVSQGASPGDYLARTQPVSVQMPNLGGKRLTESDMWGMTPIDQLLCRIAFRKLRYDGPETPVRTDLSLYYPGPTGASNWGSISVDPIRQVMIANVLHVPFTLQLVPREAVDKVMGVGPPKVINEHSYLYPQVGTPFGAAMRPFLSPLETPCLRPPFGSMVAVDLRSGGILWSRPIGTSRNLGPLGLQVGLPLNTGTPNTGGSLVTAGGLVFIGASFDHSVRAIDINTGKTVWKYILPTNANATPMTFFSKRAGKQIVVITVGGHGQNAKTIADYIYAFALPERERP